MKYLKKFESLNNRVDIDRLQKFTEDYLSYLIDKRFIIRVVKYGDYCEISISKVKRKNTIYDTYDKFKWEDVKYDFIPYFIMLNENYIIYKNYNLTSVIFSKPGSDVWLTEENILNDSMSKNLRKSNILHIKIRIFDEKF